MFGTDKNADCPLWKGPCRESRCRWHTQILGQNPNTGEQVNKTGCAVEFLPMLLIENSQQQRQTGAAVESFRNEMIELNEATLAQSGDLQDARLLEACDDQARGTRKWRPQTLPDRTEGANQGSPKLGRA